MDKKWTDEEKDKLVKIYSQGKTVQEISEVLNRSSGSIRGMKTKLGLNWLAPKPITENEKQIIIDYYNDHTGEYLNLEALSRKINRPIISIQRVAREAGLTDGNRKATDEFIEKVKNGVDLYHKSERFQNEVRQKLSLATQNYQKENGHPRGMLGKHHNKETKKKMSETHQQLFANMSYEEKHNIAMKAVQTRAKSRGYGTTENAYSRCRGGKREDLNQYFRSSWEANIARVLNCLNIQWKYEYRRFFFDENIKGIASYQPDFYLSDYDLWLEIKGWMDEKSKLRLELFSKQYPVENSKLIIIDEKLYYSIQDIYGWIDNWEFSKKHKNNNFVEDKSNCLNLNSFFQIIGYDKENPRTEITVTTIDN